MPVASPAQLRGSPAIPSSRAVPKDLSPPSTATMTPEPYLDLQLALIKATNKANSILQEDSSYSGIYVNAKAGTLTIYNLNGEASLPSLDAAVRAVIPTGFSVSYAKALLSKGDVDAIGAHVEQLLPSLDERGILLTSWGQEATFGEPSYVSPYVIKYDPSGQAPDQEVKGQFLRLGVGKIEFRPGRVAPPARRSFD